MQVALVVGHAHATVKHSSLTGKKLLLTLPLLADGLRLDGPPVLAVDRFGAGPGDRVMLTSDGAAIRELFGVENSPIRWAVLGIVDELNPS
jgi:ethanolamine utilization protein EutN